MIEHVSQPDPISIPSHSPFQTTLLDLVSELSGLTRDDRLVVAAVSSLINSRRTRLMRGPNNRIIIERTINRKEA